MAENLFTPLTKPPEVNFLFQGVQPPGQLYIASDDQLFILAFNAVTGGAVVVSGRILLGSGDIIPFEDVLYCTSDRALNVFTKANFEGFLLSITLRGLLPAQRGAGTYVQAYVARGSIANASLTALLAQGYVTAYSAVGWPVSRPVSPREGPGLMRTVVGTNPAPGAVISETVPSGATWRLRHVIAQFTTDLTVANRNVLLSVLDGGALIGRYSATVTQTASQTRIYAAHALGAPLSLSNNAQSILIPSDLILTAGQSFQIGADALQAGDDFAAPTYLVEEWVEP